MDRRAFVLAAAGAVSAVASRRAWAAQAKVHVVHIDKMAFGPAPGAIRVGDVIEWVNDDLFQHTATARNGAFDVDIKPGAKGRATMRTAGVVEVYCRYHPGMKGQLVVKS